MDKYEYNLRIEQLGKLIRNRDYNAAAKVAEQLDWRKIKQWSVMSDGIDAFIGTKQYDKARNVCVYAYNRNLGGRRLLFMLIDMYLKLGEYEDAEEIYDEYAKAAPRDMAKYTLLYRLKKAKGAPVGELIDILAEYKENELDEEYEYELALLYSEAGLIDRCIRECDEMVLWFSEGVYVEKALRLKKTYTALTPKQEEKLEYLERMSAMGINEPSFEDNEADNEVDAETDTETEDNVLVDEADNQTDDISNSDRDGTDIEVDLNEAETTASKEDEVYSEFVRPTDTKEEVTLEDEILETSDDEEVTGDGENDNEVKRHYVDDLQNTTEWIPINDETLEDASKESSEEVAEAVFTSEGAKGLREIKSEIPVDDAKEKNDESRYELEEDYDITIKVPDYSVYDTRNVQKELSENVELIMEAYRNREEKEALLEGQELREIHGSDSELVNDESGEPTKEIIINNHQWRKSSPNKYTGAVPTSDTVILPDLNDEQQNEEDDQIEGQMDISMWLSALEEEEAAANKAKEESLEATDETTANETTANETTVDETTTDEATADETITDEVDSDTETEDTEAEDTEVEDVEAVDCREEEAESEELESEAESEEIELETESEVEPETEPETEPDTEPEMESLEDAVSAGIEHIIDRGTGTEEGAFILRAEERAFLDSYLYMAGVEKKLCRFVGSRRGKNKNVDEHVAIMGNKSVDKVSFAVNLYKALHAFDNDREQRLARINAEKINYRGFDEISGDLNSKGLIVENAGRLKREQVNAMIRFMDNEHDNVTFFLIDDEFSINKLFAEHREFAKHFTGKFLLKKYTVNELVDVAKDYAADKGWRIEDKALLKLYLVLSELPNDDQGNIVNMVYDIMESAGEHAKGRLGNKLFGRFRSALLIKEADFYLDEDEDFEEDLDNEYLEEELEEDYKEDSSKDKNTEE